jgi:RNA polymerase sigma-70 factor (ECF subfamily)
MNHKSFVAIFRETEAQMRYSDESHTIDGNVSVRAAMVAAIPKLRAFAISLCRNSEHADDLVQETLLRACGNLAHFAPGTKMTAWLMTILRNQYYSEWRKRSREVEDIDGVYSEMLVTPSEQMIAMHYNELQAALAQLPEEMRRALLLVVSGISHSEAARICGCPVGTIKSRIHRARARLAAMPLMESAADLTVERILPSVQQSMDHGRLRAEQN